METTSSQFEPVPDAGLPQVLQQLFVVFADKGWLDRNVQVKYRDRRYRLSCSEKEFMAYRINDHWGVPPGIPGWLVCIVGPDQFAEHSHVPSLASDEPSAYDWLRCLASGDFEPV